MNLSPLDKERIKKFYEEALAKYGPEDPRSLQWPKKYNQISRFEILLNITNLHGKTILDVGCGFGDLYGFLKEHGIDAAYTGIDIIPEFIHIARQKHPEAHFIECDIMNYPSTDLYDVVLASGAMTFKVDHNNVFYKDMIAKMFSLATHGLAFNMLDIKHHINNDTYASYDPNEISTFCKTLSPRVEVLIGYDPQDFTVMMYT